MLLPTSIVPLSEHLVDSPQNQSLVRFSWQMHHRAVRDRFLQWSESRAPGIDDLTPVLFAIRHMDLYLHRLMPPKVGQIVVVLLTGTWKSVPEVEHIVCRVKTGGMTVLEDALEEREAWSALTMQDAPLAHQRISFGCRKVSP